MPLSLTPTARCGLINHLKPPNELNTEGLGLLQPTLQLLNKRSDFIQSFSGACRIERISTTQSSNSVVPSSPAIGLLTRRGIDDFLRPASLIRLAVAHKAGTV